MVRKKENPNFIGEYRNALSKDECKLIIQYFEESKNTGPGVLMDESKEPVVDKTRKDSIDLTIGWDEDVLPTYIIEKSLVKNSKRYREQYPCCDDISPWGPSEYYNIQKYKPNQGFFKTHCESAMKNNDRVFAWMFYLNTVTDGGGTRFPAYDLDMKAEVGKLLIWPAYFTHVHHGIVSETQTKYIATGWFSYAD